MSKTLKNLLYVFTAAFIAKILGAFTSFLVPKFLGPSNYGIWVTLLLIPHYAGILHLGTIETLRKKYPYFIGKSDFREAKIIEDVVFSSIIICSSILIFASLVFPIFFNGGLLNIYLPQIQLMAIASSFGLFSAFFYYRFEAHQNFKYYGIIDIIRSFLMLFFLVSFSWLWNLPGIVMGWLVVEVLICLYSAFNNFKTYEKLVINFNFSRLWNAVRTGFPITIVFWIMIFGGSVDRLVSAYFLGKTATGYYGLGLSFVTLILQISMSVNRVFYPKISESIGKGFDKQSLSKLVIIPAQILSLIVPVIMGVLVLMLPFIYQNFFPKYIPGIISAQIILLGSFFLCLAGNGVNFLIAHNRQSILLLIVLISTFFNVLCAIFLIKIGFNIEGIAISTVTATAILTTLVWKTVLKELDFSLHNLLKGLVKLYLPFLLVLGLVMIIIKFAHHSFLSNINTGIIEISTFVVLYSLIVLVIPTYRIIIIEFYNRIKHYTGNGK